ncbi:MAG: class I SAM-dependent methyltransferase [Actinomycetota bacterium]|nr:class I SAM-dependent methyltransferase [Actinomycetota bacterium]
MAEVARWKESAALAERYSEDAVTYRKLWAPQLQRAASPLIEALPMAGARRVLDVGCGVGALLDDLAAAAPLATIFGVDLSTGMLRLADPRFPRAIMDATKLAFASASFDVVTMCFMLFHVPDPVAALKEVERVLRPGGSIGVITWGDDPSYPALDVWTEELDRHGAAPWNDVSACHELVDTASKVEGLLSLAGFVDPLSWTTGLDEGLDVESFIEARTRIGRSKRRYESLDMTGRESCLQRARHRLEAMASEDFVDRSLAISVTASSKP